MRQADAPGRSRGQDHLRDFRQPPRSREAELSNFRSDDHSPEGCKECRPVVFDAETGEINTDATAKAGKAFDKGTSLQRKAWHRVTCLNSRDRLDVGSAQELVRMMQKELDQ